MQKIEAWLSDDGQLFRTSHQAQIHEQNLRHERYIARLTQLRVTDSMASNILKNLDVWVQTLNEIQREAKADDTKIQNDL